MAKKPRAKSNSDNSIQLLKALKFCSAVTDKEGAIYETHIGIRNNWAIAFNGIVAAGSPIVEDLICHPHNDLMIEALSNCDDTFTLTQLDNGRLSVKCGKYKAIVPCLDPALMQTVIPNPIITSVDDKFKTAIEAVGVLADEDENNVLTASILMNGQSVIATNRKVVLEYFHGNDLPPNIALPKQFVKAITKCKIPLQSFGFNNNSATFYFDDGSWIKTQLYADNWPVEQMMKILNTEANLWNIDPNFFEALAAVLPFSEDGNVYFDTNSIRSHPNSQDAGATYECTGLPKGVIYPAKQLMLIKPFVKKIDWKAQGAHNNSYMLKFEGDVCRGVISGRERQQ